MRRALAIPALLLLAAFPAAAQGILPISFAEWRAETGSQTISDFSTAGLGAALHEYGLTGAEMRLYELRGDTVQASLYRFKDPSGAYGAYSYMRTPEMARASATEHLDVFRARPDSRRQSGGGRVVERRSAERYGFEGACGCACRARRAGSLPDDR